MLLAFSLFAFSINAAHSIIPAAGAVLLFPAGTAAATATAAAGTGTTVGSGYVAAGVGAAITAGLVANQVLKGWGGKTSAGKDMWIPSGKNAPLPADLPVLSATTARNGLNYQCRNVCNFPGGHWNGGECSLVVSCGSNLEELAAAMNAYPIYAWADMPNSFGVENGRLFAYVEVNWSNRQDMTPNVYPATGEELNASGRTLNIAETPLTMAYASSQTMPQASTQEATPAGYNAAANTIYQSTNPAGVQTTLYQNPDGGTTMVEATPNPGGGATAQAVQVSPEGLVTNIATQTYPTSTPAQATSTINGTLTGQSTNPSTNPSGNTSTNTTTSLQIPTDYARQADMARAADGIVSLNEKLSGTGTPTLPGAPNFGSKIPTFLDPFVTGLNIPGGICPAPQFSALGKLFTFDSHCALWEQNRQSLQLLLTVVWYCVALAIILTA